VVHIGAGDSLHGPTHLGKQEKRPRWRLEGFGLRGAGMWKRAMGAGFGRKALSLQRSKSGHPCKIRIDFRRALAGLLRLRGDLDAERHR
jgi:hypothetical protein